jgi:Protein kinase domain
MKDEPTRAANSSFIFPSSSFLGVLPSKTSADNQSDVQPVSARLSPEEWERLQNCIDGFEDAWLRSLEQGNFVEIRAFLPGPNDALRPTALEELIKTELEIRYRQGEGVDLGYYMQQFPELGGSEKLSAHLVYEEYRVRHRYGDKPALSAYQARFPRQFASLQRLLQAEPVKDPAPQAVLPRPTLQASLANASGDRGQEIFEIGSGYRLLVKLNRGSFGDVWRAEAPGGIEVAVKIIFGSVAQDQAQRELHALESIKRFRHPFVLPIHAYWQMEDRLIIAMELADGSLRDLAEQNRKAGKGCLPGQELLGYLREAAEALDYLHNQRVVHRDIKPENILVLQGHAKVADFDLARVIEQTRRLISASDCGTPAYAAPEVFWRGKVGAHSDQYSLAATYAELRLGRPLFSSRSWYSLMNDHLQRAPELTPLLESEQRVLLRALAKDPEERYPTCREFIRALELVVPR